MDGPISLHDLEEEDDDTEVQDRALQRRTFVKILQQLRRLVSKRRLSRRLLVVSIQHDYVSRLRRAFDTFKTPIGPRAMSIKEQRLTNAYNWQRRRLLSSMFGTWVGYVQEEQRLHERSIALSESYFYRKSMQTYFPKFQTMLRTHQQTLRRMLLGERYVSALRLIEGGFLILSIIICIPLQFLLFFYPLSLLLVVSRFGKITTSYSRTILSTSANNQQLVIFCFIVSASKTGMELTSCRMQYDTC